MATNRLGTADVADFFAGLCLDVHCVFIQSQQLRQVSADAAFDRPKFRFLGEDDDIDIDRPPAFLVETREHLAEKRARIGVAEGWVGVWIRVADVAESRRAEQGVGDGVQDDVGVTMTDQPARMLDTDAAQNQRPAFRQAMRVVTDAYTEHGLDCNGEEADLTTRFCPRHSICFMA